MRIDRRGWNLSAAAPLLAGVGIGQRGLPDPESLTKPPGKPRLPRDNSLTGSQRRLAIAPLRGARVGTLRWGDTVVRQVNGRTCGAAVALVLAADRDPALAAWLQTGRRIGEVRPPILATVTREELDLPTTAERLVVAQRSAFDLVRRGALLGWDWPAAWGTPPWGLARVAGLQGIDYTDVMVNDRDVAATRRVLRTVKAATKLGLGVPLYSGGDLGPGGSVTKALPRHVVLALPYRGRDEKLRIYEPSTGRIFAVAIDSLLARMRRSRALGNWSHVMWAVLPRLAFRSERNE